MDHYDEVLEQAISLFGTKQAGEEWMARPAFGLVRAPQAHRSDL